MNTQHRSLSSRATIWAIWLLSALSALCLLGPAMAQDRSAQNNTFYRYKGADRNDRLVAAAKKAGTVTWYTSLAPNESRPVAQAFEKKYGIKVNLWRSTSDQVLQRVVAEARGRRNTMDVVETNGPEMEMMAREKILNPFASPYVNDLPAEAIPKHGLWVADRLNYFVVVYNTNLVKREELPKTLEGFLDPKWKGRIAVESDDVEWMATIIKHWPQGEQAGVTFFRQLAAMKPDVRKGHILLAQLVGAGEVPVALTLYASEADSIKRKGAPIDWLPVQPVVARPQGIGVARQAPNPAGGLLFTDFILSPDGQNLLHSLGRTPTSTKVRKTGKEDFPYVVSDMTTVIDEINKWEQLWKSLFVSR